MEKKQILLPSKRYFKASEEDLTLNVKLEGDSVLMRQGERDVLLDLPTLFDDERNESKRYKIYGKIKMVFRNMYSGTTEYTPLLKNFYLTDDGNSVNKKGFIPYNEFALLRNDVLRETNITKTGTTLGVFSPQVELTGARYTGHTSTSPIQAPYKNWNLYLTYVNDQDSTFPMKYTFSGGTTFSFTSGDGIPFRVEDNGNYYTLTSPIEHGMNSGEYVIISGGTLNSSVALSGRTFYIDNVGNEVYNSKNYVINLLKSEFKTNYNLSGVTFALGKRCLDLTNEPGTTSSYYVHKHKTLTTEEDYILDKVGFESPIWENEKKILFENALKENDVLVERNRPESVLFDFKKTFILTGITNNLKYTPTEVYATMVLRNGNGFFTYPPKVGYKFNFHNDWVDNQFSGDVSVETSIGTTTFNSNTSGYSGVTFTGGTKLALGTTLTGAFVEYNQKELKERIISEAFHRFSHRKNLSGNTPLFDHEQDQGSYYSGVTPSNTVGYYYQPHHRIKLRQLSPYIETSKLKREELINLPENTIFDNDNKVWKWRDIYNHGFVDQEGNGTKFPFINDMHYVSTDINFYLRNERGYNNKTDGLTGFNNQIIC
jgi:hypothetical protein